MKNVKIQLRLPEELRDVAARQAASSGVSLNLFLATAVAFRPTTVDGAWKIFFMRFNVANIDLRANQAHPETVRDVSEHLSAMSPV